MQTYIGVKRINAEPQERDGKQGYRVVEPDGYESWSPKDVFESVYLPLTHPDMLTEDDINVFIDTSEVRVESRGGKSTLVETTFPNGWTEYEVATCLDTEKYDEEQGKMYALQSIGHRLWRFLGFVHQWANHGLKTKQ